MKFFNRHENMGLETLQEIGKINNAVIVIDGIGMMGLSNYLFGLYDGYNYTEDIMNHKETKIFKDANPEMYSRLLKVLDEINTYPEVDQSELIY